MKLTSLEALILYRTSLLFASGCPTFSKPGGLGSFSKFSSGFVAALTMMTASFLILRLLIILETL